MDDNWNADTLNTLRNNVRGIRCTFLQLSADI